MFKEVGAKMIANYSWKETVKLTLGLFAFIFLLRITIGNEWLNSAVYALAFAFPTGLLHFASIYVAKRYLRR